MGDVPVLSDITILDHSGATPAFPRGLSGRSRDIANLRPRALMGESAGGHSNGLSRQTGQFEQIPERRRILTLREQAHTDLGEVGQLTRRRASEIFPIPHRARV